MDANGGTANGTAVDLQGPGCRVAVSLVDDAVRVGHGGVVDEDVDAILGCEQGAYIALKQEVGQHGPLNRLLDLGVGVVYELAYLLADGLLLVGQPADVVVHPGAGVHNHLVAALDRLHPGPCLLAAEFSPLVVMWDERERTWEVAGHYQDPRRRHRRWLYPVPPGRRDAVQPGG